MRFQICRVGYLALEKNSKDYAAQHVTALFVVSASWVVGGSLVAQLFVSEAQLLR